MKGSSSKPSEGAARETGRPDVLVDFEFREGLLFVVVSNPSQHPALTVRVAFDPSFRGLGGEREIARLALFRRLEFLAPGRRVETLVDSTAAYFARNEPTKVTAVATFRDDDDGRHRREIVHDLSVYRDLAYVITRGTAT